MNIHEAYTIYNNGLKTMNPQLAEAIDRIIDNKAMEIDRLREALDASEKHLITAERHLRDFKKFEFEERTEKERLREALETIDRRTMSQYLSVNNMVMDFKRIARKALEGDNNDTT